MLLGLTASRRNLPHFLGPRQVLALAPPITPSPPDLFGLEVAHRTHENEFPDREGRRALGRASDARPSDPTVDRSAICTAAVELEELAARADDKIGADLSGTLAERAMLWAYAQYAPTFRRPGDELALRNAMVAHMLAECLRADHQHQGNDPNRVPRNRSQLPPRHIRTAP